MFKEGKNNGRKIQIMYGCERNKKKQKETRVKLRRETREQERKKYKE